MSSRLIQALKWPAIVPAFFKETLHKPERGAAKSPELNSSLVGRNATSTVESPLPPKGFEWPTCPMIRPSTGCTMSALVPSAYGPYTLPVSGSVRETVNVAAPSYQISTSL